MQADARIQFLQRDFDHFAASYFNEEQTGERRVQFFITLIAAVLAGAVALAEQQSLVEVRGLAASAVAALLVIGVLTLLRIIRRDNVVDGYMLAIRELREVFVEGALRRRYLRGLPSNQRSFFNGGLAAVVTTLNTGLGAVLAWVVYYPVDDRVGIARPLTAAVSAAALAFLTQRLLLTRRRRAAAGVAAAVPDVAADSTMPIEIERRFLVDRDRWSPPDAGARLRQGYLCTEPDRTVRVRSDGRAAWLTIKGRRHGATAAEFEYEIPAGDAAWLLDHACPPRLVDKTRYRVPAGDGLVWEVDVFAGANAPLVIAEIELPSEDRGFARPDWLGEEITGRAEYSNARLAERPFSTWG